MGMAMSEDDDRGLPMAPPRCALCDDAEPLTIAVVQAPRGQTQQLAVCAACYLDLRTVASEEETSDD